MPVNDSGTTKTPRRKKAQRRKKSNQRRSGQRPQRRKESGDRQVLRLRRIGPGGEMGLNKFYWRGKVYTRSGLYAVSDPKVVRAMVRTGKFEVIPPELVEIAKEKRKEPRGMSLAQRARMKRRAAQKQQQVGAGAQFADLMPEEEDDDFVESDGIEDLGADDVEDDDLEPDEFEGADEDPEDPGEAEEAEEGVQV